MSSTGDYSLRTQTIVKGVLASQILSVPFSCSFSCIALILAYRYLSKTSSSNGQTRTQKYFEFNGTRREPRPVRLVASRIGAGLVALICLIMTLMELATVYQTAVLHEGDMEYLTRIPWTSSLVPLLTSIVSLATQTYFSDKACFNVNRPIILAPFLMILGIISVLAGVAATISLFVKPFESTQPSKVSVSEAFFWVYLIFTTLSSFVISLPLVKAFMIERREIKMEASRTASSNPGPKRMTVVLKSLLSTYSLVFVLDFVCLISSLASTSSNFKVALQSSQAFLVLQKLMVRVMALSYLYTLLNGIPDRPAFDRVNNPEIAVVGHNSIKGFKEANRHQTKKSSKSFLKPKRGSDHSTQTMLNKYGTYQEHQELPLQDQDEGEEIFSYSYPPQTRPPSPMEPTTQPQANPSTTEQEADVAFGWQPVGYGYGKRSSSLSGQPPNSSLPPIPHHNPQFSFPAVTKKKKTTTTMMMENDAPPVPPIPAGLPSLPTQTHQPDLKKNGSFKDSTKQDKNKRRMSQIRYVNSSPTWENLLPSEVQDQEKKKNEP